MGGHRDTCQVIHAPLELVPRGLKQSKDGLYRVIDVHGWLLLIGSDRALITTFRESPDHHSCLIVDEGILLPNLRGDNIGQSEAPKVKAELRIVKLAHHLPYHLGDSVHRLRVLALVLSRMVLVILMASEGAHS
jgi:hypothetical protein